MVFGRIQARRDRRRLREYSAERRQAKRDQQFDPLQEARTMQNEANQLARETDKRQGLSREQGRAYGKEFLGQEMQGLEPRQRIALQESANAQLGSEMASARRRLASEQGRRGVSGGAAFAQQQELAREGQQAQNQFMRDLTNLDAETRMKNLAALYNIEQGTVAQDLFNQQSAQEQLEALREKRRLANETKKGSKKFQRV